MAKRPLTERQSAILNFIKETINDRGFPPSLRDIGSAFGIKSTKGVNDHLEALVKKGKIRREEGISRGIEIVDRLKDWEEFADRLPVVGRIAAGTPVLAAPNIDEYFLIDRSLARGGEFLLSVQGDSMINAHICDGDYIVVRGQQTANDGEIVAALVDDEATVKRYYNEGSCIRLEPENDSMSSILIDPETADIRILGKVVGVFRSIQ